MLLSQKKNFDQFLQQLKWLLLPNSLESIPNILKIRYKSVRCSFKSCCKQNWYVGGWGEIHCRTSSKISQVLVQFYRLSLYLSHSSNLSLEFDTIFKTSVLPSKLLLFSVFGWILGHVVLWLGFFFSLNPLSVPSGSAVCFYGLERTE